MDYYSMTDKGISEEIGGRIRVLRLRKNLTQQQVADACALSLNSIKSLESGKGKLSTIIAVLRELGALDSMDHFIPDIPVSPLELARMQGKRRQRATGSRGGSSSTGDIEW